MTTGCGPPQICSPDNEKLEIVVADTVGFIGLGQMGRPMALCLLRAGHDLLVFDTRDEAMTDLAGEGARAGESLADVGRRSDRIVLCLPDRDIVETVLFGPDGLADSAAPGTIVIDCSTTHPDFPQSAADRLRSRKIDYLDAPVSGMQTRAEAGQLTAMVGGGEEAYQAGLPALRTFASSVVHVGPLGTGQLAKTLNNVLFNVSCAAMAEILPLAVRMGLNADSFCEVVRSSSGQSFGFDLFSRLALQRDFGPGYPMRHAHKDLTTFFDFLGREDASAPVAAAASKTYGKALDRGFGDENKGAMIKVWEDDLGVEVRSTTRSGSANGRKGKT